MIIYQLPGIGATAEPPYLYQQNPQLGNQVVISNTQIVRSGANNIGQLINNVAGVQYVSGLGSEPQVLIHSEPAMVLVNGQPLTNFSSANPDLDLIPLSEIQKIVITPGVAGTIYGNQSLGGVVNIITKSTTEAEQSVTAAMGSPWMNQVIATSAGPVTSNFSYRANAQNQYNAGYRDNSQNDTGNAGISLQQNYQTGSVNVAANVMRQLANYPGYLTDVQVSQNPTQSIASQGQANYQGNTGLFTVTWDQNLNVFWQAETNVSYRAQNAEFTFFGSAPDSQRYNTETVNPELSGAFQAWNRSITTDLGVMLSNENFNLTNSISGANQQQYSTYGDLDFPFTSALSLAVSGRLLAVNTQGSFYNDDTSSYAEETSQSQGLALATVGLNDQLNKDTSVYIRRAMGYQLPFIDQSNYTAAMLTNGTGFGLQPTTSTSYETGINWQGGQLQWDAEAFLINLDNEIGFYVPSDGLAANYNLSPTRRQGVTADATYELTPKWTLGSSITFMNNYFRQGSDVGNEIPGSSDSLGDVNLLYQITPIWSAYAEAQYTGAQYADGDNNNVSNKIPAYWLENVALNAQFPSWLLSFRINDITNTQYNLTTIYDPYVTEPFNNPVAYYPAVGRVGMVSLTYNFQ